MNIVKSLIVIAKAREGSVHQSFFTRFQVSKVKFASFEKPWKTSLEYREYYGEIGDLGESVAEQILELTGVVEVYMKPYEISVVISPAFSFDEIELDIVNIIEKVIPSELKEEKRPLYSYLPIKKKFWLTRLFEDLKNPF